MKKRFISSVLCIALSAVCFSCKKPSGNVSTNELNSTSENSSTSESVVESVDPKVEISTDKSEYVVIMDGKQKSQKITTTVKVDGKKIYSPVLNYEVKDTAICEINGSSIVPKSVGKTDVTISYEDTEHVVTVFVCEPTTKELVNSFDEKYVNLYGRTYISNNNLCLDHVGTGVGVAFEGTELSVTFECTGSNYVCIFIFIIYILTVIHTS